jgi:hypothetical protein
LLLKNPDWWKDNLHFKYLTNQISCCFELSSKVFVTFTAIGYGAVKALASKA